MRKYRLYGVLVLLMAQTLLMAQQEICGNRIDDDGDGLVDCLDGDCDGDVSCWECVTEFYQVHSNTTLVSLNPADGTYTTIGTISGATAINGAQLNPYDGHVYAPCIINGDHMLGRLNKDGSVVNTGLALPGSGIYYCGGIDIDGKLYITNGSDNIHYVDLSQEILSVVETGSGSAGVADFAVDNINGLLYGINGAAKLKVFDPFTESISTYDLAGSINNESGAFGAAWSCNDGSFFAYNNSSGKIYSINPTDLTATEVLNATGNLSINDGFNCLWADPPLEANCGDGIDNDGDGLIDCEDGDCFSSNVCLIEICDNGIDDDGDGWIDCSDSECFYLEFCYEDCENGIDDNGNGLVDGDDPQCSTPSGVDGGLESNGELAKYISRRQFQNKVVGNEGFETKREGLLPFMANNTKGPFDLVNFVPLDILDAYVAESTPSDLIEFTNASEVLASDYYQEEQRIASLLVLKSENVYEHTKHICDRLEGSRLLDVSYLAAEGGTFIVYELLNADLVVEYALTFSAYHNADKGFLIENHWNLNDYTTDKSYFNFQLWSRTYGQLIELLEGTLAKMKAVDSIKKITSSDLPRLFVSYGKYEGGVLYLNVRNKEALSSMTMNASIRRSETADWETVSVQVPLDGSYFQTAKVDIGYIYDIGALFETEHTIADPVFLADGRWDIPGVQQGVDILHFETTAETREAKEGQYMIERGIQLEANVADYMNIFRSLDSKFNEKDLREYNGIEFFAKGEGTLEITLIKSSIVDWAQQFKTSVSLHSEGSVISLNTSDFASNAFSTLVLDDVTAVVFSILNETGASKSFNLEVADMSFRQFEEIHTENEALVQNVAVYPNPTKDQTTIEIMVLEDMIISGRLQNSLGQTISEQRASVSSGVQAIDLDLQGLPNGSYYYSISGDKIKTQSIAIFKID